MNGREKCRILRALRDDIARQHGIEIHREECTYEGECTGTCPKCDAELEALSKELEARGIRMPGDPVVIDPDGAFELMGDPVDPDDLDGSPWN